MTKKHRIQRAVQISAASDNSGVTRLFLRGARPYLWLTLVVLLVFGQTLGFGFVNYDDQRLVSANRPVDWLRTGVTSLFNRDVFNSRDGLSFYRPLLSLSFILDHALSRGKPWVYHLTNVTWHLAACFMAFILLQKLGYHKGRSLLGSLLWALSPAAVPAVAWVPGRNDVMLAFFLLGSFLFLLRYWERPEWTQGLLSPVLFLLALYTKEAALLYPALALAYVLIFPKNTGSTGNRLFVVCIGWVLAIILWGAGRLSAGISLSAGAQSLHMAGDFFRMFIGSWWLAIKPWGTALIRDIRDMPVWNGLAAMAAIVSLSAVKSFTDNRRAFFGLLWFSAFTLFSLPFKSDVNGMLGHRLYLPVLGLIMTMMEIKQPSSEKARSAYKAATIGLALLLTVTGFSQAGIYKDDLSFWRRAAKASPHSALALTGLGTALSRRGELAGAESNYRAALQTDPAFVRARFNLGTLYLRAQRPAEARILLEEVRQARPAFPEVSYNLGLADQKLGRLMEAAENYRDQLKRVPDHYGSLVGLGALLHQGGKPDEAGTLYLKAIAADSMKPEAYINLAVLRQQQGDYDEAESYYVRAISLDPGREEAYRNLCNLYRKLGREDDLMKCLSALAKIAQKKAER